jgi:hypothetical protein
MSFSCGGLLNGLGIEDLKSARIIADGFYPIKSVC